MCNRTDCGQQKARARTTRKYICHLSHTFSLRSVQQRWDNLTHRLQDESVHYTAAEKSSTQRGNLLGMDVLYSWYWHGEKLEILPCMPQAWLINGLELLSWTFSVSSVGTLRAVREGTSENGIAISQPGTTTNLSQTWAGRWGKAGPESQTGCQGVTAHGTTHRGPVTLVF